MAGQGEMVLAVPTAGLFAGGRFQGVEVGGAAWLRYIFEPRHSRFIARAAAENDPAWKQVIPYVVLHCRGQLLLYRRGGHSTEKRLVAQYSVGLGGHIRHSDETIFATPGWGAYQAALRRELEEEIEVPPGNLVEDRLVGLINDDTVEVGRVHVGLIHRWELARPEARSRESKIAEARFAPVEELRGPEAPALESWSRFCVEGWEALLAQPGWRPEP